MTLEEVIIELTKDKSCAEVPIDECVKVHCHECEYRVGIELKDILPVLLETKKELALYKKALEMACEGMGFNYCQNCWIEPRHVHCSDCNTKEGSWVDYYLNKAREEK